MQDYGIHLVQFWPVHDGMVGRMLMLLTCEHVQLSLNVAEFPGFYSSVYMLIAL